MKEELIAIWHFVFAFVITSFAIKYWINVAKENKTPVTIATQILESCLHRAIPARSEISDLTNLIIDGACGIWLSQETSLHHDPGKMVKMTRRIIEDIKKYL